jgi:hypothetical protein
VIEFVTLFVSLVAGVQPVEVAVTEDVAAVELRLDGEVVAVIDGPPWRAECDLGPEVAVHELLAVARDGDGEEVARARQLLNVPRPGAEASFLLERDEDGLPRSARLVCAGVGNSRPRSIRVTFDGAPLDVDSMEIELPPYDPDASHVLSALVEFADGVVVRADEVFGGSHGGETRTDLTAVPILVGAGAAPPRVDRLEGALRLAGDRAAVVGVDAVGSLVLVVRDRLTKPELYRMGVELERLDSRRFRPDEVLVPRELSADRDRLQFIVPIPGQPPGRLLPADLFPVSRSYEVTPGVLPWLLTHLMSPDMLGQRLADAVAVAGVRAAAGRCPRAVLLLVHGKPEDASRQRPAAVRRYLAQLRVPLLVWSTHADELDIVGWGPARDVSTRARFKRAAGELEQLLARQRIVWVEGRHAPHTVTLAASDAGFSLLE